MPEGNIGCKHVKDVLATVMEEKRAAALKKTQRDKENRKLWLRHSTEGASGDGRFSFIRKLGNKNTDDDYFVSSLSYGDHSCQVGGQGKSDGKREIQA